MILTAVTPTPIPSEVSIQEVSVEEIYELRRRVLRNNDPGARVHIAQDDHPSAFHIGGVLHDGTVVAASSYYPVVCPADPSAENPWQLRFMAVAPEQQGGGLGGRVLETGLDELRRRGAGLLWANARNTALRFYVERGFSTAGEAFIEPATGLPHTVVLRRLTT